MKKWIIALTISLIALVGLQAQNNNNVDVTKLVSLYDQIGSAENTALCYPWASTLRLVAIKENNMMVSNLLSYENLWITLFETCLKDQSQSTRLIVHLNKNGRVIKVNKNGIWVNLSEHPSLKNAKFPAHKSKTGKEIKIYTNIG